MSAQGNLCTPKPTGSKQNGLGVRVVKGQIQPDPLKLNAFLVRVTGFIFNPSTQ